MKPILELLQHKVVLFDIGVLRFIMEIERRFVSRSLEESKKTWHIAGPAVLTSVFQFSIGFATMAFVGHLGAVELAAVSVAQNVIAGFAFGVMLGMGSALETLCGQAVGAEQFNMLGLYMQRSWIICGATALVVLPVYLFASPVLKLLHQSKDIADVAGKYCIWVIPQLFSYAANFPLQKFFQAQSKVWAITVISAVVLGVHLLLNWIFMVKLGRGMLAAAMIENVSWLLMILGQMIYLLSGYFPEAWTGFSLLAFHNLADFVKLSLASAVMMCLELWYYTAMLILVGCLKHPEVAVGAISICMNFNIWVLMIALGFMAAVSVRVSNELGANHPKAAKFSVVISVIWSAFFGVICMAIVLIFRRQLPDFFTDVPEIIRATARLGYILAATILLNSIQPVFSGVAIGAGWQTLVAVINIACYYLLGLPVGAILGFKFKLRETGIWIGMLIGTLAQTTILLLVTARTKWQKEATKAGKRVRTWEEGTVDLQPPHRETQQQNGGED